MRSTCQLLSLRGSETKLNASATGRSTMTHCSTVAMVASSCSVRRCWLGLRGAGRVRDGAVGSGVVFGGFADALQRLLHPAAQLGASVPAAVEMGDDEPAQAGDG